MPDKKESNLPAANQFDNPAQANPGEQLLSKEAEDYLCEGGKIEDYPEPESEPAANKKAH